MWVLLLIFALFVAAFLILVRRGGGFSFPWAQFYVRGKESGFTLREINTLRQVAVANKLPNPAALFRSERTLDRSIRAMILRARSRGEEHSETTTGFLSKLFELRNRLEFDQPRYRLGLSSSRNISAAQPLKLLVPGATGAYASKIVENMRKYIAVAYPKGPPLPPGFSWQGRRINVYFRRPHDASYYFETKVIGDYLKQKHPILHLQHAGALSRTQKRRSVRTQVSQSGKLFPLRSIKEANERIDTAGGYRCKMVDISEDGAAVMVGGRAKPGTAVKLQTEFGGDQVVLCGVVKSVSYKRDKNLSVLHIEAVAPSAAMRNRILTYVYGIFETEKPTSIRSTR